MQGPVVKIRRHLRELGWKLGLDIRPFDGLNSEFPQTLSLLQHHRVDLVADIGAHVGAWGERIYQLGYAGRMLSFEPLSWAHAAILKLSSKQQGWTVAPRCAIGDATGEATINISGNGESSSLLPMDQRHLDIAPDSAYVATERVPVLTLDAAMAEHLQSDTRPFLKIDAQGFERQVLDGAPVVLGRAVGLQIELSTERLYTGQDLALGLMQRLAALGFGLHAVWPVIIDGRTARTAQFDAVFMRD